MDFEEILRQQALEIHDLLSAYINLHDVLFKKSGTFVSLFKKINFHDLFLKTDGLLSDFNEKKSDLDNLKAIFEGDIQDEYREYFFQMNSFFNSLYDTVVILRNRQYHLLRKSRGEKLSFDEYMKIEKEYKHAIELYMKEGQKLNDINYLVF